MEKNLIDLVMKQKRLDADGYRYILNEADRDGRHFNVIERMPVSDLGKGFGADGWETVEEIRRDPLYDKDTFEDMIWDYCADHADSDWDGEWPEIDKESITYNEINGEWIANCKFSNDASLYMLVGYPDGNVALYS